MNRFAVVLCFSVLAFWTGAAFGAEIDYTEKWCKENRGVVPNHAISDGTFPDCLTEDYAVEFDRGYKWEPVQQALNYAMYTGKKAGVVLIIETNRDVIGARRLKKIISHYNLPVDLLATLTPDYLITQ